MLVAKFIKDGKKIPLILYLLLIPVLGFPLNQPTVQILEEVEKPYEVTFPSGILSDIETLMVIDTNYNYRIDGIELLNAIDLWKHNYITTKQLLLIIQYWRDQTSFIETVDAHTLRSELKEMSNALIDLFDEEYYLANPVATKHLISPYINKSEYIKTYYDCDDFAFLAMGIIHRHKIPAGTATFYVTVMFWYNNTLYGHALLLMKALDGNWYYYDPLTDRILLDSFSPVELLTVFG